MIADDNNMGGKTADGEIIQSDLLTMVKWGSKNGMFLTASKGQYWRVSPSPSPTVLFLNENGTDVPLAQVMATKDLFLIVQSTLKQHAQVGTD